MRGDRMDSKNRTYLECERQWVFALLIFVGGFYGSYTYLLRGGVFCNAQTANFVLFAIELGNFRWAHAAYYLIPMTAYMMGAFVSEAISLKLTCVKFLPRWRSTLSARCSTTPSGRRRASRWPPPSAPTTSGRWASTCTTSSPKRTPRFCAGRSSTWECWRCSCSAA